MRHSVSLVTRQDSGRAPARARRISAMGPPPRPKPNAPRPASPARAARASALLHRIAHLGPDSEVPRHRSQSSAQDSRERALRDPRVIPQAGRATEMSRRTARVSLCPSQPSRPNKLHKVHAPQCCLGCCSGRPAFSLFPQPAPFTPQRSPLFLRPEHIHLPSVASRRRLSKSSRSGRCSVFCSLRSLAESYAT